MTITGDYVFTMLIVLALALSVMALKNPLLLLRVAAGLCWGTLAFMMISGTFGTSIGDDWTAYLSWIFLLLAFSVFLFHMDVEIVHESDGKRWKEYGPKPQLQKLSNYEAYKIELRKKTRRTR